MSIDWGYTVPPNEADGDIAHALAESNRPRHGDKTPGQWVKTNLFNTWYNVIITVVVGLITAYVGYRILNFVFNTARWEPVRENLELFMIGLFPRAERTRVISQLLLTSGAVGLIIGWLRSRAKAQAAQAGTEYQPTSPREILSSYWALALFVIAAMAVGVRTVDPVLVAIGCVAAAVAGYFATTPLSNPLTKLVLLAPLAITAGVLARTEDLNNQAAYAVGIACVALLLIVNLAQTLDVTLSAALLAGVAGFQAMSGTGGIAWVFVTLALMPVTLFLVGVARERLPASAGWVGVAVLALALAAWATADGFDIIFLVLVLLLVVAVYGMLRQDPGSAIRFGSVAVAAGISVVVTRSIDLDGVDWSDWGGLQLNIVVATASIVLAFPFGLLLALGRRSKLPALRWMSTAYIELIRGVPLISLLLMGQFFIGFFLNTDDPLSSVTRATAAVTMFSAAYIAEIVRGGLQAVPKGQTEAGQALGLPAAKITRLLVLPQALRAVIPAMVGQFISLFKDTSLLVIISIPEFLGVREIVHGQEAFRGFGIAETLVFVGFGFWAISFTMSRESQRLERKLGVGQR
ncbi:MAG: amino acid ABC transporter permease [Ilumatobacteraceae bacterium]